MYRIKEYIEVNDIGTAVLLEALAKHPVEKLIVASSMSIYGEGLYKTNKGKPAACVERNIERLKNGHWDAHDEKGNPLIPCPTPETKIPSLASVYALSKYDQERMCLVAGKAYQIPTVALRFFNVYGTRQALSNPYTGVLAIFASRLLNDNPPMIFEDGLQLRDFVNVKDVAQACRLALETPEAAYEVFNIGSGCAYTIREIAERMARAMGKDHIAPDISGHYRLGDIRHCFADISKTKKILHYKPGIKFENGLAELVQWLEYQTADDKVMQAKEELLARGLAV